MLALAVQNFLLSLPLMTVSICLAFCCCWRFPIGYENSERNPGVGNSGIDGIMWAIGWGPVFGDAETVGTSSEASDGDRDDIDQSGIGSGEDVHVKKVEDGRDGQQTGGYEEKYCKKLDIDIVHSYGNCFDNIGHVSPKEADYCGSFGDGDDSTEIEEGGSIRCFGVLDVVMEEGEDELDEDGEDVEIEISTLATGLVECAESGDENSQEYEDLEKGNVEEIDTESCALNEAEHEDSTDIGTICTTNSQDAENTTNVDTTRNPLNKTTHKENQEAHDETEKDSSMADNDSSGSVVAISSLENQLVSSHPAEAA